jgi:hypothetical protein
MSKLFKGQNWSFAQVKLKVFHWSNGELSTIIFVRRSKLKLSAGQNKSLSSGQKTSLSAGQNKIYPQVKVRDFRRSKLGLFTC